MYIIKFRPSKSLHILHEINLHTISHSHACTSNSHTNELSSLTIYPCYYPCSKVHNVTKYTPCSLHVINSVIPINKSMPFFFFFAYFSRISTVQCTVETDSACFVNRKGEQIKVSRCYHLDGSRWWLMSLAIERPYGPHIPPF